MVVDVDVEKFGLIRRPSVEIAQAVRDGRSSPIVAQNTDGGPATSLPSRLWIFRRRQAGQQKLYGVDVGQPVSVTRMRVSVYMEWTTSTLLRFANSYAGLAAFSVEAQCHAVHSHNFWDGPGTLLLSNGVPYRHSYDVFTVTSDT